MAKRYNITDDDRDVLSREDAYDRACAVARKLSEAGIRTQVSLSDKTGRVLAAYRNGREVFFTYNGGREF